MKQQNIFKTLTIVLLLLNLGTLSFFWFTKPPHPPMPGHQPNDRPPMSIIDGLKLSKEKASAIKTLESEHHKTKKALVEKDKMLHDKLFEAIGNSKSTDSLVNEIATNIEAIEKMTIDFFNEIYNTCDESQKEELKERIIHGHKMMRPPAMPPKH